MAIINKIKSKKAQQMVEMAVVLPFIIMLIGIIITGGQLMFGKMACQMAAYEGARKAVVVSSYTNAKSIAVEQSKQVLSSGIGLENETFNFGSSAANWKKPNYLDYSVSADVKTLFPVISSDFKFQSSTKVTGHIVMMIERTN